MDHVQARGVPGETTMGGDAAPRSSPVTRERETVTDLVMEVNMMAMLAVKEILSVEAITVSSLVSIITRKMTAVRNQLMSPGQKLLPILSLTAFIQHSSDRSVRFVRYY